MKFTAYYLIEPRPELALHLAAKIDPDLARLLLQPTLVPNSEGGRTVWTAEDHTMCVKFLFLAEIRQYDDLSKDSAAAAVLGDSQLSVELFDQWWTIRRFELDDDVDSRREALRRLRSRTRYTGNPRVDSWLSLVFNERKSREWWIEHATSLRNYFRGLAASEGGRWANNQRVADQWLAVLEKRPPSEADVEAIEAAVKIPEPRDGTGWHELEMLIRLWATQMRSDME